MALEWNSTLAVGVPVIDAQHQELFRRVDRLMDAMLSHDRSEAGRMLAFLEEYVVAHFSTEEALMRERGYPSYRDHLADHQRFCATLASLRAAHEADGTSAALVHRVRSEVCSWLTSHVCVTDVALGRFLQRSAGAPLAPGGGAR
jgi:hemerythrin